MTRYGVLGGVEEEGEADDMFKMRGREPKGGGLLPGA